MKHLLPLVMLTAVLALGLTAFSSGTSPDTASENDMFIQDENGAIFIRPRSADGFCGVIDTDSGSDYHGRETIVQFADGTCNHACNAHLVSGPGVAKTSVEHVNDPVLGRGTIVITRGGTAKYNLHGASPAWCEAAKGT